MKLEVGEYAYYLFNKKRLIKVVNKLYHMNLKEFMSQYTWEDAWNIAEEFDRRFWNFYTVDPYGELEG